MVEAREQGLVRFIGVTGHGVTVAADAPAQSLERFPFDSVLLPYNYAMMQNTAVRWPTSRRWSRSAPSATSPCRPSSRSPGRPGETGSTTASTWYEPLTDQGDIDTAVHWVLGRAGVFLNTVGDVSILPSVLAAAAKVTGRPEADEMRALEDSFGLQPLFT